MSATEDTWQELMRLPYTDSVLTEPKQTLFRRWCEENRGCVGSADALAKLIGPSAICELFDHIAYLERHVEVLQDKAEMLDSCACGYDRPDDVCGVHSPHGAAS